MPADEQLQRDADGAGHLVAVMHRLISIAILVAAVSDVVTAQVTQRVNLSSQGQQTETYWQDLFASISDDGRYVAFDNPSGVLVSGDTNGVRDIFVRDRLTGVTTRVSTGPGAVQGNDGSGNPHISGDGRFVTFTSLATNLVAGDTNGQMDAFLHDRSSGLTERISISSAGLQGDRESGAGPITPDGRYALFTSDSTNLVPGANYGVHVYLRDRVAGVTENIGPGNRCSISADGRYVAFVSFNSLVPGDTNGAQDVFVWDRQLGTTERVSVDSNGMQADTTWGSNVNAAISGNGLLVAFSCDATNLVPGDTNGVIDVFVHDRLTGQVERVSTSTTGIQATLDCDEPWISDDGQFVVFTSAAGNLVGGDFYGATDVFVRDRALGTTERVSVTSDGSQANGWCGTWSVHASSDGRFVVFDSTASNLAPGDTNGGEDVFVRDRSGGPDFTSICHAGAGGVIACPCSNPPGGIGQGCDNSAATGGARLAATGGTFLSSDSLVFVSTGERPMALSFLIQGNARIPSGAVFGQGVRCAAGTLKRLYSKQATGGIVTVPDFIAGDLQVSARSAALGDTILPGQLRWYIVYYRDPFVLGGCPATSNFNATQTGRVAWSP